MPPAQRARADVETSRLSGTGASRPARDRRPRSSKNSRLPRIAQHRDWKMPPSLPIMVYEQDRSVLASLQFALALEGYRVVDGTSAGADPLRAACLIIEHRFGSFVGVRGGEGRCEADCDAGHDDSRHGDGLGLLAELRARGCGAPTVLLATNPTRSVRERARTAGAVIVEKPLLTDTLTRALHSLCGKAPQDAAATAPPERDDERI